MISNQKKYVVGRFSGFTDANKALVNLSRAGFSVTQISLTSEDADRWQLDRAGERVQNNMKIGAIAGSILGSIIGCAVGLVMLASPQTDFILKDNSSSTTIAMTVAGAGVGTVVGVSISALGDREPPLNGDEDNSPSNRQDEFLMMVESTDDPTDRAKTIMNRSHSSQVWVIDRLHKFSLFTSSVCTARTSSSCCIFRY
jgi:hypothetical protein